MIVRQLTICVLIVATNGHLRLELAESDKEADKAIDDEFDDRRFSWLPRYLINQSCADQILQSSGDAARSDSSIIKKISSDFDLSFPGCGVEGPKSYINTKSRTSERSRFFY